MQLVLKEPKVHKDCQEVLVFKVLKVLKEVKVLREDRVLKEYQVVLVQ